MSELCNKYACQCSCPKQHNHCAVLHAPAQTTAALTPAQVRRLMQGAA